MAKKLNAYQRDQLKDERSLTVHKRDDMIQTARFTLSVQEQRTILYAISKIKPDDTYLTEYEFNIAHFYRLCGIENDSYTRLKRMLVKLKSKAWWLMLPDGTESAVSWFDVIRVNKDSGTVTVAFHRDMMPYLIQLAEQGAFYTQYNLKYILPMTSQYSPRLYELLKSYQKNNQDWFFEIDKLKRLLDAANYKNFTDFRRFALDPAVEEINKYTDICIKYYAQREGRKVVRIVFLMDGKTRQELLDTEHAIQDELDGQLDLFSMIQENRETGRHEWVQQRLHAKKLAGED